MKYSFIIPVWKTEKYLKKCLESILSQTYKNFEVIVVNDGSPDNSQLIIDKYKKKDKRIKAYIKENEGLSETRNFGIKKAKGEYLILVDSDDYINSKMLEKINNVIKKDGLVDMVKFNYYKVCKDNITPEKDNINMRNENGKKYFLSLVESKKAFEMAWKYAYNRNFWISNSFSYRLRYHEDFGLTPLVILKANTISSLKDCLYYYIHTDNSITRDKSTEMVLKKTDCVLNHYDFLKKEFEKMKLDDINIIKTFNSYLSNALIYTANELKGSNLKNYIKELRKRKIFDNLMDDNLKRKIKKSLLKLYPSLFIKYM